MSPAPQGDTGPGSDRWEDCRNRFRAACRSASPPTNLAIRDWVRPFPAKEQPDLLADLVIEHLRCGWEAGHGPLLEEYVRELGLDYSDFASPGALPADLIEGEFMARHEFPATGDHPSLAHYEQRFPGRADVQERLRACCLGGDRYVRTRYVGAGGLGSVWEAYDQHLDRYVAIKAPLWELADLSQVQARLKREARVTAGLEHPAIVTVHELCSTEEAGPFYVMRLVHGRRLEDVIRDYHDNGPGKNSGEHRLLWNELLRRFITVCGAMAYAHARGVIHRDLKPQNILVGDFGETIVLDWGLARKLGAGPESRGVEPDQEIRPFASESDGVVGTLAYMSPEQARGAADARSDIFCLGAILYSILAGRPPYFAEEGEDQGSLRTRIDEARYRLPRELKPSASRDLEAVCLKAMAPDPMSRYASASELGDEVARYLTDEPVTAWLEPFLDSARRWARRNRTTVAAAVAAVLVALVAGSSGWAWIVHQRALREAETARVVQEALDEATLARGRARGDLPGLTEALQSARRAEALTRNGTAGPGLRDRVQAVLTQLERERAAAAQRTEELARDRRLEQRLETVRGNRSEHWDWKRTDAEYEAVFHEFGLDLERLDSQQAGAWIAQRSDPVDLASYLDDWALVRRQVRGEKDDASWHKLLAVAGLADPDPWRAALRMQIGRDDLAALRRLADDEKALDAQKAPGLVLLARALTDRGDRARSERVLGRARRLQPDDFWVNFDLHKLSWNGGSYDRPEEAVRFGSIAVALRPRSFSAHLDLGIALGCRGKAEEAVAELREALHLQPDSAMAHADLGNALIGLGKPQEAIVELREALRLHPNFALAHNSLGTALSDLGKLDEAIAAYRDALRLEPDSAEAHTNLGSALGGQGKLAEMFSEYREALRIRPDYAVAHNNLGNALDDQGKLDEAIAELRKALRIQPDYSDARYNLGIALTHQGKLDEAVDEYRMALRLAPDDAETHCNLGQVLQRQGKLREALEELRKGHALGSKRPNWPYPSAQAVREAERYVELEGGLPAFLGGQRKPIDPRETVSLAEVCSWKQLYAASARFWRDAFQATPALAEDLGAVHRYNAACAAVLASSGNGRDDPPLDQNERARWRTQALAWLKADLIAWVKVLESNKPDSHVRVRQALAHWKEDHALAGVRHQAALGRLPADEQNTWQDFWSEVDRLLAAGAGSRHSP